MDTDGNRGLVILVAVLAVALVVVLILWQQDRQSTDLEIDISGDQTLRPVPVEVATEEGHTPPAHLEG